MWPMYVDYSDEECRQVLRSLQLEAYASVVSALRAQGSLTKEKKKMLQDLCAMFNITVPRHKAEIRRAVNDEHLNTIAERLYGPNTSTEWALEGRRLVPLMPRLPPQTLFTAVCDSVAKAQFERNAMLPSPGKTGVRKMESGSETMASRKRKEFPSETSMPPSKSPFDISEMESRYINSLFSLENTSNLFETNQTSSGLSGPETVPSSDDTSQNSPSCAEQSVSNTPVSASNTSSTSGSLIKSPPKQIMLKSSPTVTFSSLEQLSSNLAGKSTSHMPILTTIKEEPTSLPDTQKVIESKSLTTTSPSIMLKVPSIISCSASCSNASNTSDNLLSSASIPPIGNKFLTQFRCKTTGSPRQNLSLGLKLNSQSQMSPKVLSSKPLSNIKIKQEIPSGFFTKKLPQTVFSSDSQNLASSSSMSETSLVKAPICIPKPTLKTEALVVCSSQSSPKISTATKSFPKTSSSSSMTRSLFSSATKTGAKALPPVIFNVSSISCTPLQTSTKTTTISVSSDSTKTSQLLPKSTSVGLTTSPLKLSSSNAQTIQYINDGGVVRSARIVSLSQPVASRLPCATISPSTISSLGLASNLTSSGLRASLPSGNLSATTSMRVSAAAKPNVIVVHKAQLPRTQQGTAVIVNTTVSSSSKVSHDASETTSLAQKFEKSKLTGSTMLGSKAKINIPPASPAVAAASLKIQEPTLLPNTIAAKSLFQTTPVSLDNVNLKSHENTEKSKKNLLGDVTDTSRARESSVIKVSPSFKKPLPPGPSVTASATIKISDPSILASSFINKSQADSSVSSDSSTSKFHDNFGNQSKKNKSADVIETSEISESSKKLPVIVKKPVISSLILPPAISASAVKLTEASILVSPFASKSTERDMSSNNFENFKKRALATDVTGTSSENISICGKSFIPKQDKRLVSAIEPEPCCSRNTGSKNTLALLTSKEVSISSECKIATSKGGSFQKSDKRETIVNSKLSESKEISESLVSSTSELEKSPSYQSDKTPSPESEKSPSSEPENPSCPAESASSLQPDSTVKKTL